MVKLTIVLFYSLFYGGLYLLLWSVIQPTGDGNLVFLGLGIGVYFLGLITLAAMLQEGPPPPTGRYDHGSKRLD